MEKQTVKKQKVFLSLEQLYLSIFAIILSLLITALIMLVSGENPINAFQALLAGALGSKTAIATTLGKTVPLLFNRNDVRSTGWRIQWPFKGKAEY